MPKKKPVEWNTVADVEARIVGLPEAQANAVTCALIGHSRVQTVCFGYWSCARCGAQVGDSLGGSYNAREVVAVDHHCDDCRRNVRDLTWKDTYRLSAEVLAYLTLLRDEEASQRRQIELKAEHERAMTAIREYTRERRARRLTNTHYGTEGHRPP